MTFNISVGNTQRSSILKEFDCASIQVDLNSNDVASCKPTTIVFYSISVNFLTTKACQAPFSSWSAQMCLHRCCIRHLGYTYYYLPCIWTCQHIQINLYIKLVNSRAPNYISYDFFPVKMAPMCSLIVVRKQNVWSVLILAKTPGNFRAITTLKKTATLMLSWILENIRSCLKSCCYK